ncbi:MAG TPA: alpha/beta hydrolase [Rhizomicrobium sp.]|jgi:pimeloyl-ACP methyl ester carboxylesterase|nr:alpha/beta hydrolase [Rhizomicrobium sp.]
MLTRMIAICALALFVAPAAASERPFNRNDARAIIRDLQKVVTPRGIDETTAVPINGSRQWITVRGRDRKNPILLFIHGGPAAPEMPTSWTFQNGWEDYFTVVQWDQRGAGKTYNANDPKKIAPTISLAQMVADTEAMTQYLRKTYHKPKIFALGHSWGSVLGLMLAENHPEWLYAYVGVGQVIDSKKSEMLGYQAILKAAKDAGRAEAVKELRAIAPYPGKTLSLSKIDVERKWSVRLGGLSYGRDNYGYYYNAGRISPDYSDADFAAIDKGSALSLPPLLASFGSGDFENVTTFYCPIIVFAGRHDATTSSEVVADWFKRVRAPVKKFVWFENSAHMIQIEEPGRMLVHLVEDVRPLADKE